MTPAVRLDGVHVAVGNRVLLEVPHLAIAPGERVAVVGPNGAGKSTLLKLIGGLAMPTQGSAQVLGLDRQLMGSRERRSLRRDTGLLMQGLHLVPRLSARENVLVGALARLRGADALRSWCRWYPDALRAEADSALTALGLADRAQTRADRLSGGERQKVALARVQLQRPRLLLADEPTSALDPAATREVCLALRAMADEPGRTLLTVVHDLELLPLLATRVIGIADGRVRWDRPISEVTPALLKALYERRVDDQAPIQSPQPTHVFKLARA
ncbi:MAG: phosphonate ABC transporter ATP-binding protein [Methylibium sp.]|nr:ATP-binding cassette domain-containing protein [Burkholderiaceae bacterium]MCU0963462.1 ATP-binding cassette domain-containing protein [Burkholderiaceae bacterium]